MSSEKIESTKSKEKYCACQFNYTIQWENSKIVAKGESSFKCEDQPNIAITEEGTIEIIGADSLQTCEECEYILTGSNRTYFMLMKMWNKAPDEEKKKFVFKVLANWAKNNQQNIFDETGADICIYFINLYSDDEMKTMALDWCSQCCYNSNRNRMIMLQKGVLAKLNILLTADNIDPNVMRGISKLIRALFSMEPKNDCTYYCIKLEIMNVLLCPFVANIKKQLMYPDVIKEIMLTLTTVIISNDICLMFDDANGIVAMLDILNNCPDKRTVAYVFCTLKLAAQSDVLKEKILKIISPQLLMQLFKEHINSKKICKEGMSMMLGLCIRNASNVKALCDNDLISAMLLACFDTTGTYKQITSCVDPFIFSKFCWLTYQITKLDSFHYNKIMEHQIQNFIILAKDSFPNAKFEANLCMKQFGFYNELPVDPEGNWLRIPDSYM